MDLFKRTSVALAVGGAVAGAVIGGAGWRVYSRSAANRSQPAG